MTKEQMTEYESEDIFGMSADDNELETIKQVILDNKAKKEESMPKDNETTATPIDYDVVLIGGGPANLTAGRYLVRSGLTVGAIDYGFGGTIATTASIENYMGFTAINGGELAAKMTDEAEQDGVELLFNYAENISIVESEDGIVDATKVANPTYKITLDDDSEVYTHAVILGTGTKYRKLCVKGEDELGGLGVSYCAVCDGPFFKGKDVVVVGAGNSAFEEATYLANIVNSVTLIARRDVFRATKPIQDAFKSKPNTKIIVNTTVQEILDDNGKVSAVKLFNKDNAEEYTLETDAVFIYVGMEPNNSYLKENFEYILDDSGYIAVNEQLQVPNHNGLYVVGDLRLGNLRQVSIATGDGATAALNAYRYLEDTGLLIKK